KLAVQTVGAFAAAGIGDDRDTTTSPGIVQRAAQKQSQRGFRRSRDNRLPGDAEQVPAGDGGGRCVDRVRRQRRRVQRAIIHGNLWSGDQQPDQPRQRQRQQRRGGDQRGPGQQGLQSWHGRSPDQLPADGGLPRPPPPPPPPLRRRRRRRGGPASPSVPPSVSPSASASSGAAATVSERGGALGIRSRSSVSCATGIFCSM